MGCGSSSKSEAKDPTLPQVARCVCGNPLSVDADFCSKCGTARPSRQQAQAEAKTEAAKPVTGNEAPDESVGVEPPPDSLSPELFSPPPASAKKDISWNSEAEPAADFSGPWMLTDVEGDMDSFMKELGVGWAIRTAASSMGYGKDKLKHIITHQGDEFQVEMQGPRTALQQMRIGAGQQKTVNPEGQEIIVNPRWEDDNRQVLLVEACKPDGKSMPTGRRTLEGNKLIMEIASPKGVIVKQIFKKIQM